jgi:Flp pilus assembly protein TadD
MAVRPKGMRPSPAATRRSSPRLVTVLLLALVGGAVAWLWSRRASTIAPGALQGYNLLLITIDTLRADRLGCYGSTRGLTPTLDRLASEGIRFDLALAHAPLTLPSHASILTGKTPLRHGVHDNGTFRLADAHQTLATVLGAAGYRTAAFVGSFVLDARFGLNRGFDLYDDYYGERRAPRGFDVVERPAEEVVAPGEKWIRNTPSPWFAWLHLWDPHTPYRPPGVEASSGPYDAEVAYVDRTLGAFLDRLGKAGALEKTLVLVTADHGESLGDHGEKTHGTFAYNATLKVPWLIWAGDAIEPRRFSSMVRHVDLMPTALDLLGVPPPAGLEGLSLLPFVGSEKGYPRLPSYFEALNTHYARNWAPLRGVVLEGLKFIDLPIPELYDLGLDPNEAKNLHDDRRATARRLRSKLEEIRLEEVSEEPRPPDPETLERLRALGYVTAPARERKADYTAVDDPKNRIGASNAFDEAAERFRIGDVEGAVAVLMELIRQHPRSPQAYQELAYLQKETGRLPEALRTLEDALANGVHEVSVLGLLGALLLESGQLDRAAAVLEDVVRRNPDYADAQNHLGVAYSRLGRFEDAARAYEAFLGLDPASPRAHNNLGSLALVRGDARDAIARFEKALESDRDYAPAHNGLGVAFARSGEMDRAVEAWRRAVELDPQAWDALYNVSLALADRNPEQAAPYLERFIREAPPERYGTDLARARDLKRRLASRP